ncbi:MAG: methionine adenosyltransferase [Bacteroidales bacterium]|uniref:methionine adenosyltransferase n=1 Tax=Porphyromonas sp. TaxID=1924944 RepID=UPI0029719810|nr:methionine adenosyltransferase [Porphyromonas sp.]MDD7438016.1 methionine adenosyltransferase [Bacteroidales bacterium]MDY3067723.1 methionine adenosyltransferase [Porphyromonas sp.]
MSYLFTSESVSEGHPDKVADQISDAILDHFLAQDPDSKVACETLVTTGQVVISGEISSKAYVDIPSVVRGVINRIGYDKGEYLFDGNSCGILTAISEQSPDIHRGVVREDVRNQGAGDQGMMFGYANNESDTYMPLPIELSHTILQELAKIRKEEPELMPYLRPDAKSQVTLEYNLDRTPKRVHTIVVSTQHDEFVRSHAGLSQSEADRMMQDRIKKDIHSILLPRVVEKYSPEVQKLFDSKIILHVNPTGKFVIGGPAGDTGLTGRKIIVDTYGGRSSHGGGAFSGKDSSKVDRSAAYAARYLAKNLVAAGVADEVKIQVAYAIGIAEPVSLFVDTYGRNHVAMNDEEIAEKLMEIFDLRPYSIVESIRLKQPIYQESAAYGHMGRTPRKMTKHFENPYGAPIDMEVELFPWEELTLVDKMKEVFFQ